MAADLRRIYSAPTADLRGGPSSSGRRLAQKDFDYFSQVMADYYPGPLKVWLMAEGRNRISGVYKVTGSQIIDMGVPACSTS